MSVIFLKLLNLSISASWLVLVVLVLRLVLKRAPKWVDVLLWGMVALRLMLPFSIESALSLIPSAETLSPEVVQFDPAPTITSGVELIDNAVNPSLSESFAAAPLASVNLLYVWTYLAGWVWLIGLAAMLLYALVSYLRLRRRVSASIPLRENIYVCDEVASPFILGILRPRIYLPDSLRGAARQAVLLHEQTHIRRGDPLTKPLFYAAVCLHWFNPLAWLAFRGFERDMEAACDEAAVQDRPLPERSAYCETLLQFAVQGQRVPGSLTFGQGSVKGRIVHLLHYRRLGAGALAVCIAVVGLCFAACMVRPELSAQPETTTATPESPATAETAQPAETPAPVVQTSALPTLSDAANSPRFLCPVDYKYISRFRSDEDGHRGDDLCADEGTEIYAAADGVVLAAQEHYSWGNFVEIDHGTDADGLRWVTLYAHMKSCAVQVGQTVTAGQVIGYLGHTGNTTGNACHFEMQVNGVLTEPRYFTAYTGSDAAELTQEKADEILAEAVRRAASDQTTAVDGAAALSGVDLFTLPVAPPPQVSGYAPESGHSGIDFAAEEGAEVYAVAGGIVTAADYDVEKGNYVVLDHGGGLETEYQHMKSLLVSAGQSVVQGQVLGYVGSTGNSTGPHLHFEARQDGAPADLTGTALLAE